MFGHVSQTPYDIEFSLLGIPVRIHPFFWLISLLFGWGLGQADLIVIWMLCVFVSILIHEMGHALLTRALGYQPHIVLHQFGGYASFMPDSRFSLWKSIAVSFAGPLAGFVFFAVIIGVEIVLAMTQTQVSPQLGFALGSLEWINLWWGLVNLLPVLPLDGGQICRDFIRMFRRGDGERWALRIGVVVGAAIAIFAFQLGDRYIAIMFGILGFFNFRDLQERYGGF